MPTLRASRQTLNQLSGRTSSSGKFEYAWGYCRLVGGKWQYLSLPIRTRDLAYVSAHTPVKPSTYTRGLGLIERSLLELVLELVLESNTTLERKPFG